MRLRPWIALAGERERARLRGVAGENARVPQGEQLQEAQAEGDEQGDEGERLDGGLAASVADARPLAAR